MTVREQIRKILEDVHQRDCATTMGSPGPFPCDCDIDKKIDDILLAVVMWVCGLIRRTEEEMQL